MIKKLIIALALCPSALMAQFQLTDTLQIQLLGTTPPLSSITISESDLALPTRTEYKKNFKKRTVRGSKLYNDHPQVDSLFLQQNEILNQSRTPIATPGLNFDGIGFTGVQPPDPTIAVDSNYIMEVINASNGSRMQIWNKQGTSVFGPANTNSIWNTIGASGNGDPIVIYDQLANRWLLTEFQISGNKLLMAVSTTSDPMGTYNVYEFPQNTFPDYPKYGMWPSAYLCTTNENSSTIYAVDRIGLLNGNPTVNIQEFTITDLSNFGFQSATPVNVDGYNLPPTTTLPMVWRHVDDEAHFSGSADPNSDFLEYFTIEPDFNNPANTVFNGPIQINVADFDSDLNGYFSFSGITQPGTSTSLDPLREVLMNRLFYRNFGTHESIVACHLTDVDGTDRAGVRWYEFRKDTTSTTWLLYQEGTYSPDATNRWMSTISMDDEGNIGLVYNVSSSSTYPGLRYTARSSSDPLGMMTLPETNIVTGSGSNFSNRYGDYNTLVVDQTDGKTFYFAGEYNPSSQWDTRIFSFSLSDTCNGFNASVSVVENIVCYDDSNAQIVINANGGTGSFLYSLDSVNFTSTNTYSNLTMAQQEVYVTDGNCTVTVPTNIHSTSKIEYTANTIETICNGENTGRIFTNVSGGVPPYEYILDNDTFTSNPISGLYAGVYSFYITDALGCNSEVNTLQISEPTALQQTFNTTPASTSSSTDGVIEVVPSGGSLPYTYRLNANPTTSDPLFDNLAAGDYYMTLQDAKGCDKVDTVSVLVVGTEDVDQAIAISVSPNPTQGRFEIITEADFESYTLFTEEGKIVARGKFQKKFDLDLSPGIYFIELSRHNETTEKLKIIVTQ